jgi:hypothetical protein
MLSMMNRSSSGFAIRRSFRELKLQILLAIDRLEGPAKHGRLYRRIGISSQA